MVPAFGRIVLTTELQLGPFVCRNCLTLTLRTGKRMWLLQERGFRLTPNFLQGWTHSSGTRGEIWTDRQMSECEFGQIAKRLLTDLHSCWLIWDAFVPTPPMLISGLKLWLMHETWVFNLFRSSKWLPMRRLLTVTLNLRDGAKSTMLVQTRLLKQLMPIGHRNFGSCGSDFLERFWACNSWVDKFYNIK